MDLERVISALAPTDVVGRAPAEVRDLAYDARAVEPGTLFFCVPGARFDGHDFAAEALAGGAVALVVERPLDLPVPPPDLASRLWTRLRQHPLMQSHFSIQEATSPWP